MAFGPCICCLMVNYKVAVASPDTSRWHGRRVRWERAVERRFKVLSSVREGNPFQKLLQDFSWPGCPEPTYLVQRRLEKHLAFLALFCGCRTKGAVGKWLCSGRPAEPAAVKSQYQCSSWHYNACPRAVLLKNLIKQSRLPRTPSHETRKQSVSNPQP